MDQGSEACQRETARFSHTTTQCSPTCCTGNSTGYLNHSSASGRNLLLDDGLLAKDFAGLSIEERERISKEVDGSAGTFVEESPSLVEDRLKVLEEELG